MSSFDKLLENFTGNDGGFDWMKGLVSVGGAYALDKSGLMQANIPQSGYQGGIPEYQVNRQRVPSTYDPNRRAGSGGQRYFTDAQYVPKANATPAAPMSAEGLAALNASNPAQQMRRPGGARVPAGIAAQPVPEVEPQMLATGGIAELKKGKYLDGASDGMADKVPATIDGQQEARLSDGEFVIPADVVSHLGNGNSDAGAKVLKDMMDRVRKARTGNKKQGKEIDPKKFIPA
tara:strand:+ start:654 stop:1352 length:699 start_codon:yes stop_codon:yes gene_type:complete